MAYRRTPLALEEWYHCYSRSIDKRTVFETPHDYNRFLQALYVSNGTKLLERSSLYNPSHADFFRLERGTPLVAIGAYCLMPNHFHILLQETIERGISKFMQKVGTSFAMYFNVKRKHVGNVFIKPFRSKHIKDDLYLRQVAQYIHLNPAELFEPGWKRGTVRNMRLLEKRLSAYHYSSLPDYCGARRPEKAILNTKAIELLKDAPLLATVLEEAAAYYAELPAL